jgi:hypothetical protein
LHGRRQVNCVFGPEGVLVIRRAGRSAAVGVGLLVLVGAAYTLGLSSWATVCSGVTAHATLTSSILALIALFRRPPEGGPPISRAAGGALLAWIIAATVTEQFAWAYDTRGVFVGVAWLVPPAAGAVGLLSRGEWVAGTACAAALFAGATALAYSVTHTGSGVGLIFAWLG